MTAHYSSPKKHDVIWITPVRDAISIPGKGNLPCWRRLTQPRSLKKVALTRRSRP